MHIQNAEGGDNRLINPDVAGFVNIISSSSERQESRILRSWHSGALHSAALRLRRIAGEDGTGNRKGRPVSHKRASQRSCTIELEFKFECEFKSKSEFDSGFDEIVVDETDNFYSSIPLLVLQLGFFRCVFPRYFPHFLPSPSTITAAANPLLIHSIQVNNPLFLSYFLRGFK